VMMRMFEEDLVGFSVVGNLAIAVGKTTTGHSDMG